MTYSFNDFLYNGVIHKLNNNVSYSLSDLSRVNAKFQYHDLVLGKQTTYDASAVVNPPVKSFRFDEGSLKAWSNVDTANITDAMAEWSKIIPVTFSSIVSGIPTITVSVLSRLKKMRRFASCFLLCFTLNFPAFSSSPSPSDTYMTAGANIAVVKKCEIDNEATLQKTVNCIVKFISYETVSPEMKNEMTQELYRGMSFVPKTVTLAQCQKAYDELKRFTKFCKIK